MREMNDTHIEISHAIGVMSAVVKLREGNHNRPLLCLICTCHLLQVAAFLHEFISLARKRLTIDFYWTSIELLNMHSSQISVRIAQWTTFELRESNRHTLIQIIARWKSFRSIAALSPPLDAQLGQDAFLPIDPWSRAMSSREWEVRFWGMFVGVCPV